MVSFRMDDDDEDDWSECPSHLGEMASGTITQLIEYEKPIKIKKSNIRIGFHPPERAYRPRKP